MNYLFTDIEFSRNNENDVLVDGCDFSIPQGQEGFALSAVDPLSDLKIYT